MKYRKKFYYLINVVVLLSAVAVFILKYRNVMGFFQNKSVVTITILLITVITVHFFRGIRLFLALYGTGISSRQYIKTYCKVTPVSMIFPFKIGDFFRMYCYGIQIGSFLRGVVIVLFDRFMDTVALVTIMIAVWAVGLEISTYIIYLLSIFSGGVVLIYYAFPGIYTFWKRYFLRAKISVHKLWALNMLERLHNIYREIEYVAKGRGLILYILSLIVWGIELGGVSIISRMSGMEYTGKIISEYLASAISGNKSVFLNIIVVTSVNILIVLYILIKLIDKGLAKRE
jgi:succinate dehydrogenase hydrophobic anchor subunit